MYAKNFYYSYSYSKCLHELNNIGTDFSIIEKYASVKSSEITPQLIKDYLPEFITQKYNDLMDDSKKEYGSCIYCKLSLIKTLSKKYELVHVCDIHKMIHKRMPINEYLYINLAEFKKSEYEIKVLRPLYDELDFDFTVKFTDKKIQINPDYAKQLYSEYMAQKNKLSFDQFLVNKAIEINSEKLIKIFVENVNISIMKSEELLYNILATNKDYLKIPELDKRINPKEILLFNWSVDPKEKNNMYVFNLILAVCANELIFTTTWT